MTNVIELAKQAGIEFQKHVVMGCLMNFTTRGSQPIEKIELLIKLVRNAALEEAAIAAWNHYMDTCNKNKIAPASQERWLASQPIRNLKEPTP